MSAGEKRRLPGLPPIADMSREQLIDMLHQLHRTATKQGELIDMLTVLVQSLEMRVRQGGT